MIGDSGDPGLEEDYLSQIYEGFIYRVFILTRTGHSAVKVLVSVYLSCKL